MPLWVFSLSTSWGTVYSPCGSACGSNQKTQRKNCAAVIKDYDYEKSTLWRSSEAHRLFRCPTDHQIEIFLQRNLASKHLATPLHGLCIRVLPLNFQRPSRLALIRSISSGLIATSQQTNSKTSITRSAAECKLLTWCRCPFGRWLFFAIEKIFKTGCSKRGFLSD